MSERIVLGLLSDAGGVGKTTLAVNLAYEWVSRGASAVILDLDSNHSLEDFVALPESSREGTIARVFDEDFDGNWPLRYPFEESKLAICQGHPTMIDVLEKLATRKRREYYLAKLLKNYPPSHDLIVLDCNAGINLMTFNILTACTHILIPLDMGVKVKTAARLIQSVLLVSEELELAPPPKILGLIPNRYNKGAAIHEDFLRELPRVAEALKVKLYPPIRIWQHLNNSAVFGVPLKKMRPGDPVCGIFSEIADDLENYRRGNGYEN